MVEHVRSSGKEIASDTHRGMGITGSLTVKKVKRTTGVETALEVASDVKCNVSENGTENVEPTRVDVGEVV